MPPFDTAEIDRLLTTTKSVRRRLDLERPVPREVVTECIGLAAYAPNASNAQEWKWVVVDDPDLRSAVGEQYRRTTAPVVTTRRPCGAMPSWAQRRCWHGRSATTASSCCRAPTPSVPAPADICERPAPPLGD